MGEIDMEYTTNYQLPTWVETDRIQMDDFNDMTEKIDTALGEQSETLAEHTAAIAGLGNCHLYAISYVGTGSNSVTHTFPQKPQMVILMGESRVLFTIQGANCGLFTSSYGIYAALNVSWSGNSITLQEEFAHEICNSSDVTYQLLALLES